MGHAEGFATSEAAPREVSIWRELMGVELRQRYLRANGVSTRVVEAGEGPPLVFLHGTGGHLEAYSRNLRRLSESFRVVLYDMAGHGLSEQPDVPYTIDYLSRHLVGLLDALGIERAHVSGESLGGWVAAWTAAHAPARVGGLVLNTPGNITSKPEVMATVRDMGRKTASNPDPPAVRARLEWLFFEKAFVTEELVACRRALYRRPDFVRTMENMLVLQDPAVRKAFAWGPEWCGRITAPTLLLWTDHDPTGTLAEAELLRSWIPDSRIQVIAGAGHWPQWERPAEFDASHVDFLRGIPLA